MFCDEGQVQRCVLIINSMLAGLCVTHFLKGVILSHYKHSENEPPLNFCSEPSRNADLPLFCALKMRQHVLCEAHSPPGLCGVPLPWPPFPAFLPVRLHPLSC